MPPSVEPFHAEGEPQASGQRVGVLLVHGFTGSPASMTPWGRYLAERGYAVSVPRLPGHGTTWREMNRTTFEDWYDEVERSFEKLASGCDQVVVGGLSMGGGLVLKLAAERGREVAGVVLVNAAVNLTRKDLLLLPVLKHLLPAFPGVANDIKKPGMDEVAYDRVPLRAMHSQYLAWRQIREDLPRVTQPILVFRSRVDHVLDPSSGQIIMSKVSSRDVEERVLEDSYHVATLDNDAPAIFSGSVDFIGRVTGS